MAKLGNISSELVKIMQGSSMTLFQKFFLNKKIQKTSDLQFLFNYYKTI